MLCWVFCLYTGQPPGRETRDVRKRDTGKRDGRRRKVRKGTGMIGAIASAPPVPAPPPAGGGNPDRHPTPTTARISADGQKPVAATSHPSSPLLAPATALTAQQAAGEQREDARPAGNKTATLSDEERAQVEALKKRDREVRAHEHAHASTGGRYAGSPSYSYETGPDGHQYAVEGEVPIDSGTIPGDPQATIDKLTVVIKAALAPAEPSGQDRKVAAKAQADLVKARAELAARQHDGIGETAPGSANTPTVGESASRDSRAPATTADRAGSQADSSQPEIAARAYRTAWSITAMALGIV